MLISGAHKKLLHKLLTFDASWHNLFLDRRHVCLRQTSEMPLLMFAAPVPLSPVCLGFTVCSNSVAMSVSNLPFTGAATLEVEGFNSAVTQFTVCRQLTRLDPLSYSPVAHHKCSNMHTPLKQSRKVANPAFLKQGTHPNYTFNKKMLLLLSLLYIVTVSNAQISYFWHIMPLSQLKYLI